MKAKKEVQNNDQPVNSDFSQVEQIETGKIIPGKLNPRKHFDEDKIVELAQNINEHGILQPITVRKVEKGKGEKYEIIVGERRYRASKFLGLEKIPCIVRQMDDDRAFDVMISENLQREDVLPSEEADAYKKLVDKGHTIAFLSERFGKSESYIHNRLSLVNLIPEIEKFLDSGEISIGIAVEISRFEHGIQSDLFHSHLDTETNFNSWKHLPLKVFKEKMEAKYTTLLSRFSFDKSECDACPYNSELKSLFSDPVNSRCTNSACLIKKQEKYVVDICVDALKTENVEIISNPGGSMGAEVVAALTELGIEVKQGEIHPLPGEPVLPVKEQYSDDSEGFEKAMEKFHTDTKEKEDLDRMIAEGLAKKVIHIDNLEPVFSYVNIEPNRENTGENEDVTSTGKSGKGKNGRKEDKQQVNIQPEKSLLDTLHEKDNKNKQQAISAIVEKSKQLLKDFDVLTTPLTGFEENLLYLVMMDHLNPKHLHFFDCDESVKLSDEDKFRIYKSLDEEKQNVIKRDFLVRHMNQTSGVSKKSALFIELVRLYFPEDLAAIEFDVQEEYQKKRKNILAQIKKIESRQEEKIEIKEVA